MMDGSEDFSLSDPLADMAAEIEKSQKHLQENVTMLRLEVASLQKQYKGLTLPKAKPKKKKGWFGL